jgi:hypothetical protein
MQNAYYNGWLHDHFVNAVFVFVPSGTIVACTLHEPGSWHDSFIAQNGGLYDKLDEVFHSTGGRCVVDTAFSQVRCPYLVKSSERCFGDYNLLVNRIKVQATSLRQAAEWGMRALQGSFPRLKDMIIFSDEASDRKVFLNLIPMIYNFRMHYVGLNQIRSTFYPNFEVNGDHVLDIF